MTVPCSQSAALRSSTPLFVGGSTLDGVRSVLRVLGWLIVVSTLVAAAVALGRAALTRFAGDTAAPGAQRGSFDTWPVVPLAPDRQMSNGSGVSARS